tara:strand:+ start:1033 stop:1767 length:735 start_codon:yes stop_codon:yes gene_type:complete
MPSLNTVNTIQTGVSSTSLNTLSTSGVITAGNTIDGVAPHGLNEFIGYVHTSLADFPSLSSWVTFASRYVSSYGGQQAEARASISFQNDTSNKRIIITYYGGSDANYNTVYTSYMSYTGYTGNINVQYNSTFSPLVLTNSGSSSYPPYGWPGNTANDSSAAYTTSRSIKPMATNYVIPTSGTVQFKWFIRTHTTGNQNTNNTQSAQHRGVNFNINFTSGSTVYSKTSGSKNIELTATKGTQQIQ